jgi:hypothetical protein
MARPPAVTAGDDALILARRSGDAMTNEPTICYEFALDDTAIQGRWHQANNYNLWVGRQTPQDPAYRLLERRGESAVRLPLRPRLMHTVTAGTPYRIAHLFGAWRASDADTVYLRVEEEGAIFHTLLTAMCREVREDFLLWLCPACGHEIVRERFDSRRGGLAGFWPFLLERAREFNAAAERRLCNACGKAHPLAYGFDAGSDTAEEAAARRDW